MASSSRSEPSPRENRLTLVEEQLLSLIAEVNILDHEDLKTQVKHHALAGRMHSIILDSEKEGNGQNNRAPPLPGGAQGLERSSPDKQINGSFAKVAPLNVQKVAGTTRPPPSKASLASASTSISTASLTQGSQSAKPLSTSKSDTGKERSAPIRGNKSKPLPPQPSRLKAASVIHYLAHRHLYVSERERKVLTVVADVIEDPEYLDEELKDLVEKQQLGTLIYGPDYRPPLKEEPPPVASTSVAPVEELREIRKPRNSVAPMSTPAHLAVPRPTQENSEAKNKNRSVVLIEKWTVPLPPELRAKMKSASLDMPPK
ncbi:hypothetical protein MD484_g6993, partial [Candolleomyces efflorescens]